MSRMLEKAARAAGEVAATMESDVRHLLSERALFDVARAVLTAVREPNGKMIKAWWSGLDDYYPDDASVSRGHTAMIDAVLHEEISGQIFRYPVEWKRGPIIKGGDQ